VAAEGAAAVLAGAGFAIAAFAAHPDNRGVTLALGGLLALYGVGILLIARGLWRERRWARTPAFLVQFFGLVVAWNQRGTLLPVAVVLAVVCGVAVVALVATVREHGLR
jgi:hypothetical protein